MTDRRQRYDTREELRRVQRTVGHLVDAIRKLTDGTILERRDQRATRHCLYQLAADDRFWNTRGVQQIQRNSLGDREG